MADEKEEYALKWEDVPKICEEYDKLAKEIIKREKEGRGFTFFHFMIDLTGGPCVYKRLSGCGSRSEEHRVSGRDAMGRLLSVSSVCRSGKVPHGKCG